jgi:hypothetical protein
LDELRILAREEASMKLHRLGVLAVLALATVSCQNKKPAQPAAPALATEDVVSQIRTSYQQVSPDAEVGQVAGVLADQPYAAVTGIDASKLKTGDVITIIDPEQNVLAIGSVVNLTGGEVHVRFDAANGASRRPQKGDLAVYLGKK